MRIRAILCLLAFMGVLHLQAQTIELPTRKKKEVNKENTLPQQQTQQGQPKKEQPVVAPMGKDGPITLPTTERTSREEPSGEMSEEVRNEKLNFGNPLPVVRHQEAPRAVPIVKKPKRTDNQIYESAEKMPTYPGGVSELMKFITDRMEYPKEALADSAQGIVQVSFIVEKDGSVKDFEVLDEHHPALEVEAVRILQQMPKWNPAMQNGVKVRVEYVVPVKFTLPNQ